MAAKYRCVVRVVAAFPCRAEDLLCNSGRYGLRLTLEDPTARIHAFVYAEDGVSTSLPLKFIYIHSFSFILVSSLLKGCSHSNSQVPLSCFKPTLLNDIY